MANIPPPLVREEDTGSDHEDLEEFSSDTDAADASTNPSPPENESMQQGKKSSKSPVYGSDKCSPVMKDGLPDYGNWPRVTHTDLENEPLTLPKPAYPAFETRRSRLSADWLQILQEGNKRYALRDRNRNTFRGSGFLDLDKSGNFCPNQKDERLARPPKIKVRKTEVHDLDDCNSGDETPKRQQPRTLSYEQGRKNGRSMYLRLKISSEKGIKKFKALTGEHLLSYEAVAEAPQGGYRTSFSDSAYGSSKSSFISQAGVTTRRSAVKDNDKTHDHPYQNSEGTYENLIGHREARGCRDCYDLGLECSLIDDSLSYPCENCREDDQDCILITQRNEKRPCEHCKHKRLQCFFDLDNGDGFAACHSCQAANAICIAGPAKSYRINDVLALIGNKGTASKAAAKTGYPFCTKCRKNKVRTSTVSANQNRMCRQCLIKNPSATPEASPEPIKAEKKSRAPAKKTTAKTRAQLYPSNKKNNCSSRQEKGSAKQEKRHEKARAQKINFKFDPDLDDTKPKFSASVPGGKIMHITTSYCHPIKFNWIPPPPLSPSPYSLPKSSSEIRASSFPCHFCTDPGLPYAIAGLGSKCVEVIQWEYDPTAGYEELESGWVQAGEENTRMCIQCTMERILICLCTDHMIRPIKSLDPRNFDFEGAFQGLFNQILNRGKPDHEKIVGSGTDAAEVKWCSICIEPALFECCVRPPFTTSGLETSPSDDIGCGLLLCEVCAFRLTGRHYHRGVPTPKLGPPANGDRTFKDPSEEPVKAIITLDAHINAASKDIFHYSNGLRADSCFLRVDSELMRRQGAGDGGENRDMDVDEDLEYDKFQDRGFKKRNWGMGSPIDLT